MQVVFACVSGIAAWTASRTVFNSALVKLRNEKTNPGLLSNSNNIHLHRKWLVWWTPYRIRQSWLVAKLPCLALIGGRGLAEPGSCAHARPKSHGLVVKMQMHVQIQKTHPWQLCNDAQHTHPKPIPDPVLHVHVRGLGLGLGLLVCMYLCMFADALDL